MKAKALTALLATALLAAGCATVPTKGPIRNSGQDGAAPGQSGVGVEARHPRENAAPVPLVNSFLEAMSDSSAFDVAREYLAPDAANDWNPGQKISVYDQSSPGTVVQRAGNKVQLLAPLIGVIDTRGSWAPALPKTMLSYTFQLVKVSDQWRVTNAPPGVFLGSNQLEGRLAPRSLYFFNPSKNMLVPDPVFLPIDLTPGQEATQLVQELLKGPTSRLGNGVATLAPPGTTVNVSVPVDVGVATVALSDEAGSLVESDRERLAAQILWTLRPITTKVRITAGGAPLLPDEKDPLQPGNFTRYDPIQDGRLKDLYGLRDGKIQKIQGQDGAQDIAAKPLIDSLLYSQYNATAFAVNLRGDQGAVVSTTRGGSPIVAYGSLLDRAANPNDKVEPIPVSGKVLRPSYDNDDNLWVLDRADSGNPRLRFRSADGKLHDVRTEFGGNTPLSLRMAPDGVRALLVMKRKSGITYVVTATVQTNDAKQLMLGEFRPLNLALTEISDASWNNLGILVAGRSKSGEKSRPWQVNVDGSQPRLIPGASDDFDADKLASNPNIETLPVVQDPTGQLHWQKKDLTWVEMNDGAKDLRIDPVYPG